MFIPPPVLSRNSSFGSLFPFSSYFFFFCLWAPLLYRISSSPPWDGYGYFLVPSWSPWDATLNSNFWATNKCWWNKEIYLIKFSVVFFPSLPYPCRHNGNWEKGWPRKTLEAMFCVTSVAGSSCYCFGATGYSLETFQSTCIPTRISFFNPGVRIFYFIHNIFKTLPTSAFRYTKQCKKGTMM